MGQRRAGWGRGQAEELGSKEQGKEGQRKPPVEGEERLMGEH